MLKPEQALWAGLEPAAEQAAELAPGPELVRVSAAQVCAAGRALLPQQAQVPLRGPLPGQAGGPRLAAASGGTARGSAVGSVGAPWTAVASLGGCC